MKFYKRIKHILFFLLTVLLSTQLTYAKTELVLPQIQVSFSIEQNQIFNSLKKAVPPNIGFLKEKTKFDKSTGSSTRINCNFSKSSVEELANGGGYIKFLDDPLKASSFADEIIDLNKATEGGGTLLSGTPSSAINTAGYYATVPEQGASIFKTIIKNHMFMDGNKRTAVEMFKSFCSKSNITTSLTDTELMNIATQVATGQIDDVLQISQALIK